MRACLELQQGRSKLINGNFSYYYAIDSHEKYTLNQTF